jgi:2-polyprenyl-3-methyl-5-hydroxy-6-metoxy-1,4-benzoquinol methylase
VPPLNGHRLRLCGVCNLTFADQLHAPEDLYHTENEGDGVYATYVKDQISILRNGCEIVRWPHKRFFEQPASGTRLLDVGCGSGFFVSAASRRGWEATGIDLSASVVSAVRDALRLDVRIGTIDTVDFPDGTFDAITAWELLEHLQDPAGFADQVFRLLKPSGIVALSTPNWGSRWPRTTWRNLRGSMPPIHITFWTTLSLRWLLENAGFVDVQVEIKPWAGLYEVGGRSRPWRIIEAILRTVILRQPGGQLFACGRKP